MKNAAVFEQLPDELARRYRMSAEYAMRRAGVTEAVVTASTRTDLPGRPLQFVTTGQDANGNTHDWAELHYG